MPLHVVLDGPADGPLVVLVHGSMDRAAGFGATVRRLRDRYRVVAYDRRGYAGSLGVGPPFTLAAHVDDVLGLLDRPGVIVGHSLGGLVAIAAAIADPERVRAVGMYETPMSWTDWWPPATVGGRAAAASEGEAAEVFLRAMIGDELWERLPERTREARRAEGPALVAELREVRAAPPYDVAALTVPCLVAHGTRSAWHHHEGARRLAALLGTEPTVIEGADHRAQAGEPDAFAAWVDDVVAAGAA